MKISILSPTGMHQSELKAIQETGKSLPEEWKAYCGIEIIGKNCEIDMVMLVEDRIIVVEIKEWNNGSIESDGQSWFIRRGQSITQARANGVRQAEDKCRKIYSLLKNKLYPKEPFVDKCVLWAGNARTDSLPPEEQKRIIWLNDFIRLSEERVFNRYFGPVPSRLAKNPSPIADVKTIDSIFLNKSFAIGKSLIVHGYQAQNKPCLSHPLKSFVEFIAQPPRRGRSNSGLLRRWNFYSEALSREFVTYQQREKLLYNEDVLIKTLKEEGADKSLRILDTEYVPEDISNESYQISLMPVDFIRLSDLLGRPNELTIGNRMQILINVFAGFAEFHRSQVVLGDLASHMIWLNPAFSVRFSNFLNSHLETWKEYLPPTKSTAITMAREEYHLVLPHNQDRWDKATDIALSSVLAKEIIAGTTITSHDFEARFNDAIKNIPGASGERLVDWVNKLKNEGSDFKSLEAAHEALLVDISQYYLPDTTTEVCYQTDANIWVEFPAASTEQISNNGIRLISPSKSRIVDTWSGIAPYSADKSRNVQLISFLKQCESLSSVQVLHIDLPCEFGYCIQIQTVFVAYEINRGQYSDARYQDVEDANDYRVALKELIERVSALHRAGISFGGLDGTCMQLRRSDDGQLVIYICSPLKYGDTESRDVDSHTDGTPSEYPSDNVTRDLRCVITYAHSVLSSYAPETPCLDRLLEIVRRPFISEVDIHEACHVLVCDEKESVTFTIAIRSGSQFDFPSDDGQYYVRKRAIGNSFRYYITGSTRQVSVSISDSGQFIQAFPPNSTSHRQYVTDKKNCHLVIVGQIVLMPEKTHQTSPELIDLLREIGADSPALVPGSEERPQTTVHKNSKTRVKRLWELLLEAETSVQPTFRVAEQSTKTSDGLIQITLDSGPIEVDYEASNIVEARIRGSWLQYADVVSSDDYLISCRPRAHSRPLAKGTEIRVSSIQSLSNFRKRQNALADILENRCAVPQLADIFLGDPSSVVKQNVSRFNVDQVNQYVQDLKLNDFQAKAFAGVVNGGPLSLVQGPPGTGKTFFTAACISFILEHDPLCRILVVGQSHEAVNNILEKLLQLCPAACDTRTTVRLGNDEHVSHSLSLFKEQVIREQFLDGFESTFTMRVRSVTGHLPLPMDAINAAIDYSKSFELHLVEVDNRISKMKGSSDECASLLTRKARMIERLVKYVADKYKADIGIQPHATAKDISESFYVVLQSYYGITNEMALEKLRRLIGLSMEFVSALRVARTSYQSHLVQTRRIVAGTCVGVSRSYYDLESNTFDWVFIDEAARASFSELAIPMRVGLRIVLVGDQLQLPPQIDPEVTRYVLANTDGYSEDEVATSDFERALSTSHGSQSSHQLLNQYRMSSAIGDIVSEVFYDNTLVNNAGASNPSLQLHSTYPLADLNWLDTSVYEAQAYESADDNSTSIRNGCEARLIYSLIESHLINLNDKPDMLSPSIGVICMYKSQVSLIRSLFMESPVCRAATYEHLVEVGTVDSFQGRERDIILLSLVRSNPSLNKGFLRLPNRINVAISRAKNQLIIVGDSRIASSPRNQDALSRVYRFIASGGHPCASLIQALNQ